MVSVTTRTARNARLDRRARWLASRLCIGGCPSSSENPFVQARRWFDIDQIAVDPDCRRTGIASALIRHAISEAHSEGVVVEAASWSFNEGAHELFRQLGFVLKTIRFELKSAE
jgi:GNAT superfamily N-acetyltransferase